MSPAAAEAPAPPPIPQLEPPAAAAAPVAGCQSKLNYSSVFMPPEAVQTFRLAVTGTRNYSCLTQALQFGPAMALSRGVGDGLDCESGGVGGRRPPAVLSICCWQLQVQPRCVLAHSLDCPARPHKEGIALCFPAGVGYYTSPYVGYMDCSDAASGEHVGKVTLDTTVQGAGGRLLAGGREGGCCQLQHWSAPCSCLAAIAILCQEPAQLPAPAACRPTPPPAVQCLCCRRPTAG